MRYRPEIDGLRAVAVIPVILFHAGIPGFSGGYVGVDVFFVLSGYLISGIILADLQKGQFSLSRFYERRVRRILPALLLTLILCSAAAWYWFLPRDFKDFSQSLTASALFVSNLLFLREQGYFDAEGGLKPLLHTWSLSIEEQYYILFPLFLGLLWRRMRGQILPVIILMLMVSFAWSCWLSLHAPRRGYFVLTSRGWELLTGVIVMLIMARSPRPLRWWDDPLAFAGLALILWSVLRFDAETPFPGPAALLPVLGTALMVLYARPGSLAQRLLALRPLVLIGLVSYSAYLFHQPLLAFQRYLDPAEPSLVARLLMAGAALPLAWLSWRYVERPFRLGLAVPRRTILTGAVISIAAVAVLGVMVDLRNGYVRFDLTPQQTALLRSMERSGLPECRDIDRCLVPPPRPQDVLLIGDSNAFHFSQPLAEELARHDRRLISLTKGGCFPSDRVERNDSPERVNEACRAHYGAVFNYLGDARPKPDTVILSAAWASYFYGSDYFSGNPRQQTPLVNARVKMVGTPPLDDAARRALIADEIAGLMARLSASFRNVCVIGPFPYAANNFRGGIPAVLAGIDTVSRDEYLAETHELQAVFDADTLPRGVMTLFPHEQICRAGICEVQRDGRYLYSDMVHVSDYGARTVFADLFASHPECLGGQGELPLAELTP